MEGMSLVKVSSRNDTNSVFVIVQLQGSSNCSHLMSTGPAAVSDIGPTLPDQIVKHYYYSNVSSIDFLELH